MASHNNLQRWVGFCLTILLLGQASYVAAAESVKYEKAAPILRKYCQGCHNADDQDGDFAVDSFAALQRGGERGRALIPGDSNSSRLIRVLVGDAKPKMPPEGEAAPSSAEIQILRDWIDAGAVGPKGKQPLSTLLRTPQIASRAKRVAISHIAASPNGKWLAVAKFRAIEILDAASGKRLQRFSDQPGKVNSLRFSADGTRLAAASGVSGVYGLATVWNLETGKLEKSFQGHRDVVFSAVISPDSQLLATGSYDRRIMIWDMKSGKLLRTLSGHNDAVYDLDFSPDGSVLASASGDETLKVWRVADGVRLDTLGQPQGEQYVVRFSPDGSHIVGGGVDNRIRVWSFVSKKKRQINPLLFARFAHEGPIVALAFSSDGKQLISAAEDRSLKAWSTKQYVQIHDYQRQPDVVSGIAATSAKTFTVARMDGSTATAEWAEIAQDKTVAAIAAAPVNVTTSMNQIDEVEPNGDGASQRIESIPATIKGRIKSQDPQQQDVDVYRINAKRGQRWIVEVNAARSKSPLDSFLEILDAKGKPIPRVKLQAVRDSYFTFRGKDSNTIDDFRLHNWEEMELNEYLYCNGEVVKLWLYPRGPDSGFKVYPGEGKRYGFFDTTPTSHALQEPCYIVEAYRPDETINPNGLPVFTLYYENDDDARRKLGADSKLHFTAPYDGEFLVRLRDVRGHGGDSYKYALTIRPAAPDFQVKISGANPKVNAGSGKEFQLRVDRIDGFDGEIKVDISGLPPGFRASTPLVIQAGQNVAIGSLFCAEDAAQPTKENAKASQFVATAMIDGRKVVRKIGGLGEIKMAAKPKVIVRLASLTPSKEASNTQQPLEFTIQPGQTIKARVIAERINHKGIITFGKEDSGRNLPHGVYVDNIGLNGLMMRAEQNERVFFITAAKWVPETTRTFHLQARVDGNQTTQPVVIHVRRPKVARANE